MPTAARDGFDDAGGDDSGRGAGKRGDYRFNVSNSQLQGSGDNLPEQSRPLLQVEDIQTAVGGETAMLESRDEGYFVVDVPNFWERPELSGYLRDVRAKPDRYGWLDVLNPNRRSAPAERLPSAGIGGKRRNANAEEPTVTSEPNGNLNGMPSPDCFG